MAPETLVAIGVGGVLGTVWLCAYVMDKLQEHKWYYTPMQFTWFVIGMAFLIVGAIGVGVIIGGTDESPPNNAAWFRDR